MSEATEQVEFDDDAKTVRLGPRTIPIPDDWETVPFEEAIELNPRYDKPDDGPFDFLPMDAVNEETQTIEYWNQREKDDCTTTWFKNGDTVYAKITPCTENGKIAFVNSLETEVGSGSTEFLVFHAREGISDKRFVYYLANMPDFRAVTISLMEGSTGRQRVPSDVFAGGLHIPLPPLSEQRRIAEILSTVDEQIKQTKQTISLLEQTQDGLVQDFLTSGLDDSEVVETDTRLGKQPDSWEITTIEDIVADEPNAFTDGARSALRSAEIYDQGEARVILLEEVGEGEFNDSNPKFATDEKYEEITHRAIYSGEVVLAKMASPVARACIVPDTYDRYLLGCADVVRIATNDQFDPRFLKYCLNSHKLWRQATSHLRGTGRSRINLENVAELLLPKPSLSEQIKIAEILETVESQMKDEERNHEHLQELKRGLMQDLLTGKKRVDPSRSD